MHTESKRVAVVTGVASGIGNHIAICLLQAGYLVYGLDRNNCALNGLHFYCCDVSKEDAVARILESIVNEVDHIDYLIHAAGILCCKDCYRLQDLPLEEWNKVLEINLTSAFLMAKHTIPYLSTLGCILNFSTEQVTRPSKKSAPYAVSKAGIEILTRTLAVDLIDRGIRANTIALGTVQTNFIRHLVASDAELNALMETADSTIPLGIIRTQDVWELVRYLLSDGNKITGQTILLDSGMTIMRKE